MRRKQPQLHVELVCSVTTTYSLYYLVGVPFRYVSLKTHVNVQMTGVPFRCSAKTSTGYVCRVRCVPRAVSAIFVVTGPINRGCSPRRSLSVSKVTNVASTFGVDVQRT